MKRWIFVVCLSFVLAAVGAPSEAKKKNKSDKAKDSGPWTSKTFNGLKFRGIGPALTSGRIGDIAVDPQRPARQFVAVASGGVWRTLNSGTTWEPVFDKQGSYSIGCVTLAPGNPLIVWVGTGENNSQRSVSYGDGVYKSIDGGTTWEHMGLAESEHIGKIWIDPRDSNRVFVAAQGPLWNPGGDRGLYRTVDGGKTWTNVLEISENTGVTDLVVDPRNPDVMYAASYQRRRRVWTLINGGPESALYKTEDGGDTWNKLTAGLPKKEIGRIGLAISPVRPDVLYAVIEAQGDTGGFFRSQNAGASWSKRSGYVSGSPQYYQELVPDPQNVDRVYSMDTWMQVTEDGGATFRRVGERSKHVDNHAMWIDPENTDYLLAGCDGGIYESFDRGANWHFKANLPITQFYKITVDNDLPFYNVYGGTQDNFTLGGPSRTRTQHGITNRDWFVTLGGDGFEPQVDPQNPDIVYSQYQYGGLARFDRKSGESIDIQPQAAPGDDPLRWNWDSALIISPHSHKRLYYAAQRVFRSNDYGNTWLPISGDLTRAIDRNQLEVMGKVQSVDAVSKNRSTSPYGNIVSMSESTLLEGLLYIGTDDGLVQVLEPETDTWRKIDRFGGAPEMLYVSDVETSRHDQDTVYICLDAHKDGDFKPYVLRSTDRGRSWTSISANLPERGTVYTLVEDHVNPNLLFVGTEFGVFFSTNGGQRWVQLKGGIPVIAVRDLDIQRRENDLVAGTFGRGIYILDDYTPLRSVTEEMLDSSATLFEPRPAPMFMPWAPLGLRDKSFQGDSFFTAPNPPFGAVFTYYLDEGLETLEAQRQQREKEATEDGTPIEFPSWDELRQEDREQDPAILLTVEDAQGHPVRTLTGGTSAGFHRVAWDLRFATARPTDLSPGPLSPFADPPRGPMVLPGRYRVQLWQRVRGETVRLGEPQSFEAKPLNLATLGARDRTALLDFQRKTARLQRAVLGAVRAGREINNRIRHLRQALHDTPGAAPNLGEDLERVATRLQDLQIQLSGDRTLRRRQAPTPRSIVQRVQRIVSSQWSSSSAPTQTNRDAYRFAGTAFQTTLAELTSVAEALARIERQAEDAGAPWTPSRIPRWSPE